MATLANFPMKNQRDEKTLDGKPPENGNYDCVPTSLAAAIQYLTGKPCSGDELKDAEYGDAYKGGTALRNYVDNATDKARAVYGVNAEAFNSTSTVALIHQARAWLRQGFPVIATIPSQWGNAYNEAQLASPNFSSHVVVFYTEDGTHMGAMNPWGGFLQAQPDAWWAERLCYGQVWKIYKETTPVATQQQPYDKVFNDAVNAEKARDALQVENAQLKQQLADALAMIADLKAHATSPSGVVLTQKQKDELAAFEALQKALAE